MSAINKYAKVLGLSDATVNQMISDQVRYGIGFLAVTSGGEFMRIDPMDVRDVREIVQPRRPVRRA